MICHTFNLCVQGGQESSGEQYRVSVWSQHLLSVGNEAIESKIEAGNVVGEEREREREREEKVGETRDFQTSLVTPSLTPFSDFCMNKIGESGNCTQPERPDSSLQGGSSAVDTFFSFLVDLCSVCFTLE